MENKQLPRVQAGGAPDSPAFVFAIKEGRASVASSVEGSREARCSYLAASGACLQRCPHATPCRSTGVRV